MRELVKDNTRLARPFAVFHTFSLSPFLRRCPYYGRSQEANANFPFSERKTNALFLHEFPLSLGACETSRGKDTCQLEFIAESFQKLSRSLAILSSKTTVVLVVCESKISTRHEVKGERERENSKGYHQRLDASLPVMRWRRTISLGLFLENCRWRKMQEIQRGDARVGGEKS